MPSSVENEYSPDEISLPGETLQEILEERGLSQTALAKRTGRPKKTINEIIKGKTAITAETALQLERVLGIPASFWNARQRNYEEWAARRSERHTLEGQVDWLKQFPIKQMVEKRWIECCKDKVDQLRELLSFFGVASPEQWENIWLSPKAAFRDSPAFVAKKPAVAAWLRQGEIAGRKAPCNPFDAERFKDALKDFRALTRKPIHEAVEELKETSALSGVAVVLVPSVPGVRANGATRWLSPTKALMQLCLRGKRADKFWFTVFHEAGHILLHGKKMVFIEEKGLSDDHEQEADLFAKNLLIPPNAYTHFLTGGRITQPRIVHFADQLGISPDMVLGRLQKDGKVPHNHFTKMLHKRIDWAQG